MQPLILGEEVTIATAAHGNATATRLCLQSIVRSATGNYELILIDDCSPDAVEIRGVFAGAKELHRNTTVFSFTENLEYTGSVNAILSHARGQWVFFVSNDISITPFYLRMLLDAAQANPRAGILRGSSNFVDNGLPSHNLPLGRPLKTIDELFEAGAECARRFGQEPQQQDPFLVGDAFMVTRPLLEKIGTFDPWFYGYFADPDFGLRARIAGFESVLVRGAFAYHLRDANFDYLPEEQRKRKLNLRWMRVFENWARFKLKYGLPVSQPYESIAGIPWVQLATQPFDAKSHFSAPGDYTRYLVGESA